MKSAKKVVEKKEKKVEKKAVKKVVKKVVKKAVKKPRKVTLLSYSMRMVIPTGDYANIQPEIIVKAGSADEAHAFIAPHMNKLWKEYYNISKRKVVPVVKPVVKPVAPTPTPVVTPVAPTPVVTPVAPTVTAPTEPEVAVVAVVEEPSPVSSVALAKATQAIQSCLSIDAFNMIVHQIKVSTKLTEEDKLSLGGVLMEKEEELNATK